MSRNGTGRNGMGSDSGQLSCICLYEAFVDMMIIRVNDSFVSRYLDAGISKYEEMSVIYLGFWISNFIL